MLLGRKPVKPCARLFIAAIGGQLTCYCELAGKIRMRAQNTQPFRFGGGTKLRA